MGRIDKFKGKTGFKVGKEDIVLNSFIVNDLFELILFSQIEDVIFDETVNLLVNVMERDYPEEERSNLEAFIVTNYTDFVNGLVISIGWLSKEELEKSQKDKRDLSGKKRSLMLFKARMAAEAESETLEERYVTFCYSVLREFGYTLKNILEMPASTFLIIIEEVNKQAEREKKEAKDKGSKRFK